MKRTLAFLLALAMVLSLCACGSKAQPAAAPTPVPELDAAAKEIIGRLEAKGFESGAEATEQPDADDGEGNGAAPVFPLTGKRMNQSRIDAADLVRYIGKTELDPSDWESEYGFEKTGTSSGYGYNICFQDTVYMNKPTDWLSVQIYFDGAAVDYIVYFTLYESKEAFDNALFAVDYLVRNNYGEPYYFLITENGKNTEAPYESLSGMLNDVMINGVAEGKQYSFCVHTSPGTLHGSIEYRNNNWTVVFIFVS